jgi:hypothetical protein
MSIAAPQFHSTEKPSWSSSLSAQSNSLLFKASTFAFSWDQPILMVLALQRSWSSAMTPTKSIDWKPVQISAITVPTIGTFARAAVLANLLVTIQVVIVFSIAALQEHALGPLQLALWLVALETVVVWTSASAFYVIFLVAKLLRVSARRLVWASGKSVVRDDWLDSP